MKGCFRWLGIALVLGLLFGVFVGTSLYVDARGLVVPGQVLHKHETISHTATGSWSRRLDVEVRYQPHDQPVPNVVDIGVDAATYDHVHVGSTVDVRYAPNRTLRDVLILPAARLAGQSTLGWARLLVGPSLRTIALGVLGIVLFGFWLLTPRGKARWWRAGLLAVWSVVVGLVAIPPTLAPVTTVAQHTATATVKVIDRITLFSRSRRSRRRTTNLLAPYDLVQLEWTPPGLDTPVEVVDGVDPDSIPNLAVGTTATISYAENDPRAAQLVGGTRNHRWVNLATLPVYVLACLVLWLLGQLIAAPFRRRRRATP